MATQIVIPEVGESVTSGVIAAWTKADGDWVERDETVLELETDKITMEIPAPAAGVLKHDAAEGDTVDVGQAVGAIDESAEKPASAGAQAGSKDADKSEDDEKKSDKRADKKTEAKAGSDEPSGSSRAEPDSLTATRDPAPADSGARQDAAPADDNGDARATPLARKLAEERGIDLSRVRGTGAGNRIREQDVLAFVQSSGTPRAPDTDKPAEPASGPSRATSLERMSPMRQRIASRLVEAQQTAAMLTTFNEVDMSAVMATRSRYKEGFQEKHGVGLGFMSFFVKAAVNALRAFPLVNAYIVADDEGRPAVRKHDYCDVAIAVASPKGLVVPVIRSAETKSFAEIESAVKEFAGRAKDGKLTLEEMQGGTFTITNGGVFGSLMSTPILNPPQSAILGMHTIRNRPVEDPDNPGQIVLRPMMYLALSYDHRIVDGADAVRFLVSIKDSIEDPRRLLFDL